MSHYQSRISSPSCRRLTSPFAWPYSSTTVQTLKILFRFFLWKFLVLFLSYLLYTSIWPIFFPPQKALFRRSCEQINRYMCTSSLFFNTLIYTHMYIKVYIKTEKDKIEKHRSTSRVIRVSKTIPIVWFCLNGLFKQVEYWNWCTPWGSCDSRDETGR